MNRFHIGIGNNSFPLIPGNDLRRCINYAHHMAFTLDKKFGETIEALAERGAKVVALVVTILKSF